METNENTHANKAKSYDIGRPEYPPAFFDFLYNGGIKDSNPKYLLTMDMDFNPVYDGIRKLNVVDWLLNDAINSDGGTSGGTSGGTNSNDALDYEEIILKTIQKQGGLTAPQISAMIGKSKRTTERYISKLKTAEKIEFKGALKTGGYYAKTEK